MLSVKFHLVETLLKVEQTMIRRKKPGKRELRGTPLGGAQEADISIISLCRPPKIKLLNLWQMSLTKSEEQELKKE